MLEPDAQVGREIRDLRKARQMTLDTLAAQTSLSKGHLSQIERGVSSPSVRALHAISRALGVTVSWFFRPVREGDEALRDIVVRKGMHRRLKFESGIEDELLSPSLDRSLELLRSTLPPGAISGRNSYSHTGDEAGIVTSGTLELWVDGKHVTLQAGDSFAFESALPHRYENRGDCDVVVIWAISPPSF